MPKKYIPRSGDFVKKGRAIYLVLGEDDQYGDFIHVVIICPGESKRVSAWSRGDEILVKKDSFDNIEKVNVSIIIKRQKREIRNTKG